MTLDQNLDRLIDEAARQMARHEPSAALSSAVMERVAAPERRFARRPMVWGSAAAAAAAGVVLIVVSVNRPVVAPIAETRPVGGPELVVSEAAAKLLEPAANPPQLRVTTAAGFDKQAMTAAAEDGEAIAVEPLAAEPIVIDRLDVAQTTISPVEIAPVEIEPISTAND